mmetsp:Transcript_12034/g.19590  ORF Transcript_12034/g.19590 Transcript_12034/m.19590 type:complete len:99 (+) Transcript_12034:142-438(+)
MPTQPVEVGLEVGLDVGLAVEVVHIRVAFGFMSMTWTALRVDLSTHRSFSGALQSDGDMPVTLYIIHCIQQVAPSDKGVPLSWQLDPCILFIKDRSCS